MRENMVKLSVPTRRACRCAGDRSPAGFTIVELLVVIGVIALLIAIIAPALFGAKTAARQAAEIAAARQLMLAYSNYAMENRDALLPGYLDSPKASDAYGTSFASGQLAVAARRYVWRLAPWMNFDVSGLYPHEMAEVLERLQQQEYHDYLYAASISPAFGLNSEWIGGDQNAYGFLPADHPLRNVLNFNQFYLSYLAQARHPQRLMVFTSARGVDPQNPSGGGSGSLIEGYFKITSPYFTELTGGRWSEEPFLPSSPPEDYGHVSPRFHGQAVATFIDGHVGSLSIDDLRDMRYWANWADARDWRLPQIAP
jgi:prepilin-type N-terminal cleavage/methylation domain-containing protein